MSSGSVPPQVERGSETRVFARRILSVDGIDRMVSALKARGFSPIGPTVRDGAIVYDRIESVRDLPAGWSDEQERGTYRLVRRTDGALFGYTLAAQSWKRFLFQASRTLFSAKRDGSGFSTETKPPVVEPLALIGVRPCELRAIEI